MMKMHNVDTMSLTMTFRRYNEKGDMDWNYIHKIEDKIAKKMVLYEDDKQNRDRERRYNNLSVSGKRWLTRLLSSDAKRKILSVYRHGKYDDYIFTYNETWQSLTIMLTNSKVEEQSATDIKQSVIQAIMDYLELKPEELNELVVNRIDICCDFNYDEKEEIEIITNILDKAPNGVYTYRKHLLKDDKDGYILKYYSVRKNKEVVEPLTIEDGMITIPKKESEHYEIK